MFIYPIYNHNWRNICTIYIYNKTSIKQNILTIKIHREVGRAKDLSASLYCTGVLISPLPDQEGNKPQQQKILMFIYPIIIIGGILVLFIYIYITRLASNEIFSPSNQIHWEVGRAKDLPASLYRGAGKSLAWPGRKQATVTEDFEFHISYLLS